MCETDTGNVVRKIQLFRSRNNIPQQRDANINFTCLTKGPTVPFNFVLPANFPVQWHGWQSEFYFQRESNPGPTSVCATKPHGGAGASAHVLNHTTSPTKHTTQDSHLHPKTHHTTQSKHHEQHAYPYYK